MTTNNGFPGGDLLLGAAALGITVGVAGAVTQGLQKNLGADDRERERRRATERKNKKLREEIARYKSGKSKPMTRAGRAKPMTKAASRTRNKPARARGKAHARRR